MTYTSGLHEIKHNRQHMCEPEVQGCEYPLRQISDQRGSEVMFKCFSFSLFPHSLPKWMGSSEISANLSIQPPVVVECSIKHFSIGQIGKGVRQGCMLSPCLFNLYAEYIMRNAGLEEAQAGIKIAGRIINNLRYADDPTLMEEIEEVLMRLLLKVKEESEKVGLKLSIQKTKIMASDPITLKCQTLFFGLQNHCRR